jgi:site-specific recombinase XerD
VCPDSGLARLSYGQARALLDQHTALNGSGTGWDLHEFRHSALTHLGEAGASLLMPMTFLASLNQDRDCGYWAYLGWTTS